MQDLIVLGVICISTLVLWAAGRAACNYHVPGESLTPRKVSLEDRTRSYKHTGIEFAQALSSGDFAIARKLARGEALAFVKKDENDCGSCSQRKDSAEKVMSVGTVLEANSVDSIVKVRTVGGVGGEKIRFFGIEREGRDWIVTRVYRSKDDAQLKEAPTREDAPAGIRRPEDEANDTDGSDEKGSEENGQPSNGDHQAESEDGRPDSSVDDDQAEDPKAD